VGISIIFSFLKLIPKESLTFDLNACIGIGAILISIAEILFFNVYVSGLRTSGAKAQETFDCNIYGLSWNSINSGSQLERYVIEEGVSEYVFDEKAPLENWYDIDLEELSKERAILLCQETNLFYDGKLREHFKIANVLICILIFVLSLIIAVIAEIKVGNYVTTILLPVSPMIVLTLKIIMENRKSLTISTELRKIVLQLKVRSQNPTIPELRGVQDKIFCNRKDSSLVPNWYYKWRRNRLEKLMKVNASNPTN
jgi:SMODS-associating 4TM effector domain